MGIFGEPNYIDFIVRVQNEERIKELNDLIKSEKQTIAALNDEMQKGIITEAQFWGQSKQAGQFLKARIGELNELNTAMKTSATSGRVGAYGLMQIGYAMDDLQYGFSAVVNNITPIVYGLTGSMGIAGAAQIAAVGISQLVSHWGELSDLLQSSWTGSSLEQLSDLRKRAEEAAEGFDKLSKVGTKLEQKGAKGIEEAITEGPVSRVLEGVLSGIRETPGLRAERKDVAGGFPGAAAWAGDKKAIEDEIAKKMDEADRNMAVRFIHEARLPGEKGDSARTQLKIFAKKHPELFPEGFLGDIENMDPAELAKQDKLEREGALLGNNMLNKLKRKQEEEKRVRDAREALAKGQDQQERADDQHRKEQQRQAEQEGRKAVQFNRQMRQLFKMGRAPEEDQRSQFIEGSQFAKFGQTGGLNAYADEQKRQTRVLERIRELIEDDPMNKFRIAGRMAGMAARAAEPN